MQSHVIEHQIAGELNARPEQVQAAVRLLDEGATVPFIARYRKEVTGGLDDSQLRTLESRLGYLRELAERRQVILRSIEEQGKLTPELARELNDADSKTRLEDLYLPYKPKRRTKGQMAIEAGLEPLADLLLSDPMKDPEQEAVRFLNAEQGITDGKAALDGARYILMERFAEQADLLEKLRDYLWHNATLRARVVAGKEQEGAKFKDYFEHDEPLHKAPSHRVLAMLRGRNEGILNLALVTGDDEGASPCEGIIAHHLRLNLQHRPADKWLQGVVSWTWKIKLSLQMETELIGRIRESAEDEAIKVFAMNLKDLLMAAPAGMRCTMGLDPGIRTGVKVAVVDATGKLVDHATIYPFEPKRQVDQSLKTLSELCQKHKVELISIGNGTASRETDRLVSDLFERYPAAKAQKIVVSEAGASVYSASELASQEFPDLDVSIRGAVSIARRLQDPLAELVKIDPKSIGVGQYQHDVGQSQLARRLDAVVEDCVNAVGVDVNTASVALLNRVSGLSQTLAQNIVAYRDENGAFQHRQQLLKVSRLGPKAFEQCAGFLRIRGGSNPLDGSAVHPESYPVVERILAKLEQTVDSLLGNSSLLRTLKPADYTDEQFGVPTVTDIIGELDKPGRDPRPEFKTATFKEGVEKISDLVPEMVLEGVVTNVTNFGAFVDIGVHQDGLVHISSLTDRFVKDPREVVKAGDIVRVKVQEVDVPRKRISLTMRLDEKAGQPARKPAEPRHTGNARPKQAPRQSAPTEGAMGNAFAAALSKLKK
ncbi:RNA-binding transcriptional accessory protein [Aeromonas hydrophila]|uniref:Tex family protein n=1 Tax=Aeromonas hydrophila TaxID=644 RepID=UPI001B39F083|nr:Tex family protein [Aeromonas hydrophila]MBQ4674898.1 S1 RNA-binding domain-containing protein [Aeromonas hydrophila]MBW3816681.1 S1 RNA-binding domain-containing protein [Aeromonas hydrophila]MCF7677762.1 RNA-binding transcriptional accessory protein [Aeromonas hydrophila]MCF7690565.1 RNA-binding transcriptional accessory protein [Aeromonas hydrophila]MCF7771648.1 RNA-binding transcriptional accessory protein [Aeromonas hydrophila]